MTEINALEIQQSVLNSAVSNVQTQAESIYNSSMATMQEKLSLSAEAEQKKYNEEIEEYRQQYLDAMADCVTQYANTASELEESIQKLTEALKIKEETLSAHIANERREQEKLDKINFYRINLTNEEILEIDKLRELSNSFVRSKESINKIIWDVYFKTPTKDLLNRIIDSSSTVGIYKITNLNNQKVYIGQSVTLQERLKTHIRCGLGAASSTSNTKLYKAMKAEGVENFSFEILEYCNKDDLNEKEKYWIKCYQSYEYGYNSTIGNG